MKEVIWKTSGFFLWLCHGTNSACIWSYWITYWIIVYSLTQPLLC